MSVLVLGWKKTKTLSTLHQSPQHKEKCAAAHHGGGHGDVEKLSSATLRNCSGEEELVSVLGEERRFVLQGRRDKHLLVALNVPAGAFGLPHNNKGCSAFITYLSVQPALTLIFMFLEENNERERVKCLQEK